MATSPMAVSSVAMSIAVIVLSLLPLFVKCSGEGNIRLLAEEVAVALKACTLPTDSLKDIGNAARDKIASASVDEDSAPGIEVRFHRWPYHHLTTANQRQRRSEDYPRIDNSNNGQNLYDHERRNSSDMKEQMHILNATDYEYGGYGSGSGGEKLVSSVPRPASGKGCYNNTEANGNRTRRSEPLLSKTDSDQCLSQCIFANLQVVDSRGIPREAEFWNKVQSSVTSQQSRAALRDQVRECFQELQSEAEDNGCSYSNKLERCLMLRFSDRKINGTQEQNQKT